MRRGRVVLELVLEGGSHEPDGSLENFRFVPHVEKTREKYENNEQSGDR